jgi:hypothetical protein
MGDVAEHRLTKVMISGPRDVFILYDRSGASGNLTYKIQRNLASGVRDADWYAPEQMDDGVLSALLPRYVRRQYENDQARLEQDESQENKDPFEEGWLYAAAARGSDFPLIDDIKRLKATKHAASVASLESDAYIIDLFDTTDAALAQKRGEKCLKAIMDEMPKKPQKWGSGKNNLDGLVTPGMKGSAERMFSGEIVPQNHPLHRCVLQYRT